MSYKDLTGKSVDLVGLDWYKEFRSAIEGIHQSAQSATTKQEMLDVLEKLEQEMSKAPVEKLVFDIAWRIQYFQREGFEYYRKNVAEATRPKKPCLLRKAKDVNRLSPIYGVVYDLDNFLRDLRRVISESTPVRCTRNCAVGGPWVCYNPKKEK